MRAAAQIFEMKLESFRFVTVRRDFLVDFNMRQRFGRSPQLKLLIDGAALGTPVGYNAKVVTACRASESKSPRSSLDQHKQAERDADNSGGKNRHLLDETKADVEADVIGYDNKDSKFDVSKAKHGPARDKSDERKLGAKPEE
jgi:hypothetical protein